MFVYLKKCFVALGIGFTIKNNCFMYNIFKRAAMLVLFASIAMFESRAQDQMPISFNNIPQWIEEHIEYPKDGAGYGIEQFCISVTSDGRVFLASRPYTLDPTCEQAIINAVKSAPRCYFEGDSAEDIFKVVSIDFARNGSSVGLHSVPVFKHESTGPFNGRHDFASWAARKYKMPKELKKGNFADTLSVRYQIDDKGCVNDVMISKCGMPEVETSLKKLLLDSPQWKPALAESHEPIAMTLEDMWILKSVKGKAEIEPLMDPEVYAECLDENYRLIKKDAVDGESGKRHTYNRNIPEDFGRHYVYLTTPPYARNRAYMQSDGSYSKYPFNAQGQFNHKEYQNQQIRAAKQSATGNRNFDKKYNRQLKKSYSK